LYLQDGGRTFSLSYHFPSFAWRVWPKGDVSSGRDQRKKVDGSPWRVSQDASFLRGVTATGDSPGMREMLHETQQSVTTICYDRSVSTTISLNDTYFYVPDRENEDTIDAYVVDPSTEERDVEYDPITIGKKESSALSRDPIEYFLWVMVFRLRQILDEWQFTEEHVRTMIWTYVSSIYSPSVCTPSHNHELTL
jgi:hypothetical protein